MASSSVSQEDVDIDFETSSRRSRIRTARARNINPTSRPGEADEECEESERDAGTGGGLFPGAPDHDANQTTQTKESSREIGENCEKRDGALVLFIYLLQRGHLCSQSTGGSTGEDEELLSMTAETRRNTHYNEHPEKEKSATGSGDHHHSAAPGPQAMADHKHKKSFTSHRNKSPSDLEADDEDNQDYDSLTMSDSTLSLVQPASSAITSSHPTNSLHTTRQPANGRPATPTSESVDELLESAREENRRLLGLLEERDRRISSLESRLSILTGELTQACTERSNLRQENTALIRAMASLTAK
ncbi:putative PRKC apoptosis WT1 regulator protein-like [Homarus americanus]|uniref:Putative PRKC apoptosis WT1 regulator protein-like n=1 Tax=Homarus americanus TaxID=6706 RepID=A0A8J5N665_HOMAM|nr:putative PRKC apoptosis WT1 regulator protein-like [Homarus americanus]